MTANTEPVRTMPDDAGAPSRRIDALDVVRGFALCGILLVNVPPLIDLPSSVEGGTVNPVRIALDLFVQERFFPIFCLLFGVGFGLMWLIAAQRSARPRLALLRRFGVLFVLGLLHQFVHPGEALLPYALAGIVFLLPVTWVRGRAGVIVPLILGVVLLAAGLADAGSAELIPGLFLIGFGAGRSGRMARIVNAIPGVALVATLTWVAALIVLVTIDVRTLRDELSPPLGLVLATAYVATLLLLLHTPVAPALRATLAPLGRMALTNYLGATAIVLALRPVMPELGIAGADQDSWLRMIALCVAILVVQSVASTLWLRRFGQGPLEAAWRVATWGRQGSASRVDARRTTTGSPA